MAGAGLAALAVGGGGRAVSPDVATASAPALYGAGLLRLAMQDPTQALDPQFVTDPADYELFRCCLLRTLYSYRPGSRTGQLLVPDLASGPPQVSRNRLVWTFHIRPGVRYAPPFQADAVTSYDVRRALLRLGRQAVSGDVLEPYFRVIKGFSTYVSHAATTMSGVETPDARTLRITLTQPAGDLAYRFSLPATAPIPPSPQNPSAPLGAASGHDFAWGQFLVSTGPYMYAGAQTVDYSKPARRQVASGGFEPGTSLVLVPNPSWSPATDPIRRPMPRRIDVVFYPCSGPVCPPLKSPLLQPGAFNLFTKGRIDAVLDARPPGARTTFSAPSDSGWYASLNTAYPPFDDEHVRRAVALVLAGDRANLLRLMRPAGPGRPATHDAPDGIEANLVGSSVDSNGGLPQARAEMRASRYGTAQGRCQAAACVGVPAIYTWGHDPALLPAARRIAGDLRQLGIDLRFTRGSDPTQGGPPRATVVRALDFPESVAAAYPDPSTFFVPAFSQAGIATASNGGLQTGAAGLNISLVGATRAQLMQLGYGVTSTPTLEPRIGQCLAAVGAAETQCWAYLDSYLTTVAAPWVPIMFGTNALSLSRRLGGVEDDPLTGLPALEALRPAGSAQPPPGLAQPPPRCLPPPVPVGLYHKRISAADLRSASEPAFIRMAPVDSHVGAEDFIPGRWIWIISAPDRNCVYGSTFVQYQDGGVHYTDAHPFTVPRPDEISLHGSGEGVGTYRVERLSEGRYQMVLVSDPPAEWNTRAWVKVTNPWLTGP